MSERRETTMEAWTRFGIAVGACVTAFAEAMRPVMDKLTAFYAHLQANSLERQGRMCRDKRKRNRYFRKAKRLRRQYPLRKD